MTHAQPQDAAAPRWILLIHSIPPRPNYLRVKIGRRLQKLGAVAVKNSVYAHEIASDGGEASLCESRFIGGLTDDAIEQQFRFARQRDYLEATKLVRGLVDTLAQAERRRGKIAPRRRAQADAALARLKRRLDEIVAIDHFGAPGRAELENLLGAAASAWLIRRFIDADARLKYVEAKGYAPAPGELRFDMFDAEFTHEGDLCTFEVLLARMGTDDRALRRIADMVHDIDLQHREDDARLAAGATMLDVLYRAAQQRGRA